MMKEPSRPTLKSLKVNGITRKIAELVPPPAQGELFHVEKQIEYQGVEMGVLENGVPYLSESGLARMCGIDRKVLNNPQPCFAYPDSALGIFRAWLRRQYITSKFPQYLLGQAKQGKLEAHTATKAIEAFTPKKLTGK